MELVTPGFGLIFWQTLAFLIVLFILRKVAWKPILGALRAREDSIDDALKAAELAKEEMKLLKANNEKLLAKARKERDEIIGQAKEAGEELRKAAAAKAEEEAAKILVDAKAAIDSQRTAMMKEVRQHVAELSVEVAERLVRQKMDDAKQQEKLLDEVLTDLKSK